MKKFILLFIVIIFPYCSDAQFVIRFKDGSSIQLGGSKRHNKERLQYEQYVKSEKERRRKQYKDIDTLPQKPRHDVEDDNQRQQSVTERHFSDRKPVNNDKKVSLVVNGTGQTKEEATKNALRSAIEQTFGTFVSANTEVVNDELVKDEIATVTSGNIDSYSILSSTKNGVDQYEVSLHASVSIDNLTNYVKSKGFKVELAGAEFVMNMKMRELNKKNEYASIQYLYKKIESIAQNGGLFDYVLEKDEPIKFDDSHYGVKLKLLLYGNKNTKAFYDEIYKTIQALSLSELERKEYDKINLDYYIYDKQLQNIRTSYYKFQKEREKRSLDYSDYIRRLKHNGTAPDKNRKEWYDDVYVLRNYYPNLSQWRGNSGKEIEVTTWIMPILIEQALKFDIYDNLGNHFYCSSAKSYKEDQYYVWCYRGNTFGDVTFFSINPQERVSQINKNRRKYIDIPGGVPAIPLRNYYSQFFTLSQEEELHFNPLSTYLYLDPSENAYYEKEVLNRIRSNCYYQLDFIALYSEEELFNLQYIAVKNRNSEILSKNFLE